MPIPPYVSHLRTMVGRELLWMPGVTAVVLRAAPSGGADEVLLVKRSDNGAWTPVTGIVDPGEESHVTAVREVLEEACVVAQVERLVWGAASGGRTDSDGHRAPDPDPSLRRRSPAGEPRPGAGQPPHA